MEKAKNTVREFVGAQSGKRDTTVHQKTSGAVEHETVRPQRHEEVNTAVDREIHQDHYHTTEQPIYDREVLPERHEARLGDVEHREFDHRRPEADTKRSLEAEAGKFRDERKVAGTEHSRSEAPEVRGEHVHHHLYETTQPVIHKETVQPTTVHTTKPIHERHQVASVLHGTSTAEPVSRAQFEQGQRGEIFDTAAGGTGKRGAGLGAGHEGGGWGETIGGDGDYESAGRAGGGAGSSSKLMDRLNPKVDSTGDGKTGFLK